MPLEPEGAIAAGECCMDALVEVLSEIVAGHGGRTSLVCANYYCVQTQKSLMFQTLFVGEDLVTPSTLTIGEKAE
jgi:hypothetical protein